MNTQNEPHPQALGSWDMGENSKCWEMPLSHLRDPLNATQKYRKKLRFWRNFGGEKRRN
jgi:hypothetical protein